ncbi:MAG: DUF3298 domain-containing protein [Xanthobacteraceae bacterium]
MPGDHGGRTAWFLARTMPPLAAVALLCATMLATLAPALPAGAETILSGETKAVSFKLTVADAFKATPVLFDNLAGEGKTWIEKNKREAEKEYRQDPSFFADGRTWSYERGYTHLSTAGPYVSVLRTDFFFSGGAHPNTEVDTILWNADAKKRVSVRPFFTETKDNGPTMRALAKLIRDAVAAEKRARDIPIEDPSESQWLQGIQPSLLKLGPLALARSTEAGKSGGLTVHFSPYAVGPYVEGRYTVLIPWRAFARYLSPEGRAVFGGEPIKPEIKDE